MLRFIKYLLVVTFSVILAVTVAGSIIAWYYKDEVKQYIVDQINRHIRTEIRVSDISFSVLRKFPHASVRFSNVIVKVPSGYDNEGLQSVGSDTLFTARNLFLSFNVRDIFKKEYRITSINAVSGGLYLAVNSSGLENYRFWDSSTGKDDGFRLDLQDVRIDDFRLKYENSVKRLLLDTDVKRLDMKGDFSRSSYRMKGSASAVNRIFRHQDIVFTQNHDLEVTAAIDVNGDLFTIEGGTIDIAGFRLNASGYYDTGSNGRIGMDFMGSNLYISSLVPLMPAGNRKDLEKFQFKGRFDFEAAVTGQLSKSVSPSIVATFITEKAEILRTDSGMKLTGIDVSGYYSNGSLRNPVTSSIVISNFSSGFGNGNITGEGTVTNLNSPFIDADISASFLLGELAAFYRPENIHRMEGRINTVLSVNGILQRLVDTDLRELAKMDIEGMLEIEDGLIETTGGKYTASSISGDLYFGKTIRTPGLSFNIGSDHFSLTGQIENGLPWLMGSDQTMSITGSFNSKRLDIDNYILPASSGQQGNASEPLIFPPNVELSLDFMVDNLTFRKFSSTGFSGKLSYKPRMMILNAVEFNSMDGKVSGNGVIAQRMSNDFMVQSRLELQDVDMQKMFYSFNDFSQTFISGHNLKGTLSGSIGIISEWSGDLQIRWDRLIADSKVDIKSGELIGFEPMMSLAKFIDINELQHIRFSTLRNEIFIRNELITIPQMDINSSAFNITGSGTHRFDGQFDYRLRLLLSDVLYGKAGRSKPENVQFGIIEDDGLGRTSLYLKVAGTSDDFRVSYDRTAVREVIRENIANERNVLRHILNEEFGWFGSDTSVIASPAESTPPATRFIITWDEEDEKTGPATPERPSGQSRRSTGRNFRIIWDEEKEKPDTSGKK